MICIGTIQKAFKNDGQFYCRTFNPIKLFDNGSHRLSELKVIELRSPNAKVGTIKEILPLSIKEIVLTKQMANVSKILISTYEFLTPESIYPYHGWGIWIDKKYSSPCDNDEYYYDQILGAQLIYQVHPRTHIDLGRVLTLIEGSAHLLLELALSSERYPKYTTMLLPFHHSIIGAIHTTSQKDTSKGPNTIEVLSLEYFESLLFNH